MAMVRLASRAIIGTFDGTGNISKTIVELGKIGVHPVDVSLVAKSSTIDATPAAKRGRGPLGAVGSGANWLVDPKAFDKPDFGKLLGAGPLADVLSRSPSTSPVGALVMQGIPQHDAKTFSDLLGQGKVLILIGVVDRTMGERVRAVLDRAGSGSLAYYSGRPYGTAFHGTGPGLR
jgi:hypothetical protein